MGQRAHVDADAHAFGELDEHPFVAAVAVPRFGLLSRFHERRSSSSPSPVEPGRGMSAATSVPPSAGLSTRSRPSRTASRSAEPHETAAVGPGASDAVVAHLDSQRAVLDARRDRGAVGARVLRDVGQRLGDDEVGGRLDRGREPAHGHVDLDRHRHPRRQRVHSRAQPAVGEDRREDAVRELAQLGGRLLGVVERLGHERGGVLLARSRRPGAASFSVMTVWTRRCCAPSCRSRTTRRRSSSVAATIRARDAASVRPRLDVRDRRRDQLGELLDPRLRVRRQRPVACFEETIIAPQRRPSTTIGPPTDERMPSSLPERGGSAGRASS